MSRKDQYLPPAGADHGYSTAEIGALSRMLGAIIDLALAKRAVTLMVVMLVIAGGIWAARQLKIELLPNMDIPVVTVMTIYPTADPDSVLNDVTVPVESAVAGLPGLKSLDSISEAGVSVVVAQFAYGTDLKRAVDTINRNLASAQLPAGSLAPKVSEVDLNAFPIMRLSVTGKQDTAALAEMAERQLVPQLGAVDGVSSVQITGSAARRVVVSLKADQLKARNVTVSQVVSSLRANNVAAPSGGIPEGGLDLPVRVGNQLLSLQDVENLIVLPSASAMGGAGGLSGVPQSWRPPSPDSSEPTRQPDEVYQVKPGDTLSSIAQRFYGDAGAFQRIVDANKAQLSNPNSIRPGMTLIIPAALTTSTTPGAPASPPASIGSGTGQVPGLPAGGQIPGMAIPQMPSIPQIYIRDLGQVALGTAEDASLTRTNGQNSVGVLIFKTRDANTVRVADAVNHKIAEIKSGLGDAGVVVIEDQSTAVRESISGLEREGLLGGLFAVLVIFLFLFNARSTMVTAVSIPVSILVAFLLMGWRDLSLNIMTMGGLTVSLGRVVDDAIVVLENIYRHVQRGESPMRAASAGAREVSAAITISTLTTVAVFLPLGFVGGIVGQVFTPFALTVTFALLASLAVALTIIPVLATFLVRPGRGRLEAGARSRSPQSPASTPRLHAICSPGVSWALRHRRATLGVAAVLFVGSLWTLPFIGTSFLPSSSEKLLQVTVEMPPGTNLHATEAVAEQVENQLSNLKEVEVFQTTIGNTGSLMGMTGIGAGNASTADIFVRLVSSADVHGVAESLRQSLSSIDSAASIVVSPLETMEGGSSKLQVTIVGDDYEQVSDTANRAVSALGQIEGLANVRSDLAVSKPEVSVKVKPDAALQHGLTAIQVVQAVRDMITGQQATKMTLDGKPIDVYVQVNAADKDSLDKLKALTVGTINPVPLSEIADVRSVDGPVRITRHNQARAATISGDVLKADTGAVSSAARQMMNDLDKPAGVRVQVGGVAEQMMEGFSNLGIALAVAVGLVYLVMVATMGSLSEPLVILASLPLASVGALLALLLTGRSLGMSAMIGMLMLVGIVVTNAVVLLDLVGQLRRRGFGVREALIEGGRTRVRPILMTAAATILALTPLMLGFGQGSLIASELATVVVGGLLTSTLLTLLVVPVVYSLVQELTERWGSSES
ncbi:MAG: LysM peptidoglycan-binding domain-containing protein [Chloroflexota bacterium]|nr:MAG: LysM peptidoglycan-binding domain-containing protein [Chloroflexota bacterium]